MARVLVVEDEPTVRELVSARLRSGGHQVLAADSGAAAEQVVGARGAPDVVVLDVGLPDTDGYSLLARLRDSLPGGRFGAVFLSGEVDQSAIDRGRRMGATYLTKPFVATALLAAITSALPPPEDTGGW